MSRCGILIIGSLLWDNGADGIRKGWREDRLSADEKVIVRAPICYGRKSASRNDTFTMILRSGEANGQAVLVPCRKTINSADDLMEEITALWRAEDSNAKSDVFHKNWGCVGALFRTETGLAKVKAAWSERFQEAVKGPVDMIGPDGFLKCNWPKTIGGEDAELDIILATATKPAETCPSVNDVADAWCHQSGEEKYFFRNVENGIRTSEDLGIWERIKAKAPSWIDTASYAQAKEILGRESKTVRG